MSKEIRSECPEKVHYAHDFALVNEILECLKWKSEAQKRALDSKGLIVNERIARSSGKDVQISKETWQKIVQS